MKAESANNAAPAATNPAAQNPNEKPQGFDKAANKAKQEQAPKQAEQQPKEPANSNQPEAQKPEASKAPPASETPQAKAPASPSTGAQGDTGPATQPAAGESATSEPSPQETNNPATGRDAAYEAGKQALATGQQAVETGRQKTGEAINAAQKAVTEATGTVQGELRNVTPILSQAHKDKTAAAEQAASATRGLSTEGLKRVETASAADNTTSGKAEGQSGEAALKSSLSARGIDYDGLSDESKQILAQNGGIIDTVKGKEDLKVADVQKAAEGAKGLEVKGVEGLAADDGTDLFGASTSKGEVLLESALDGASETLKSVAIEEISDNAFQQIAKIEAAAGKKLAGSTDGYLSAGDFGQEVAQRAEGTATEASLAALRGASSGDTIMVNGAKAEANDALKTIGNQVQAVWSAQNVFPFDNSISTFGQNRANFITSAHNDVVAKTLTALKSMNSVKGNTYFRDQANSLSNALNSWGNKLNTYANNARQQGDNATLTAVQKAGRDFGTIAFGKKQQPGLSPGNAQMVHFQAKALRDTPENSGAVEAGRNILARAITTFNQAGGGNQQGFPAGTVLGSAAPNRDPRGSGRTTIDATPTPGRDTTGNLFEIRDKTPPGYNDAEPRIFGTIIKVIQFGVDIASIVVNSQLPTFEEAGLNQPKVVETNVRGGFAEALDVARDGLYASRLQMAEDAHELWGNPFPGIGDGPIKETLARAERHNRWAEDGGAWDAKIIENIDANGNSTFKVRITYDPTLVEPNNKPNGGGGGGG